MISTQKYYTTRKILCRPQIFVYTVRSAPNDKNQKNIVSIMCSLHSFFSVKQLLFLAKLSTCIHGVINCKIRKQTNSMFFMNGNTVNIVNPVYAYPLKASEFAPILSPSDSLFCSPNVAQVQM